MARRARIHYPGASYHVMCANGTGLRPRISQHPGRTRNCSEARAMIALLVWYEDHLSLTDLGTRLGRDLSNLSQAVNRLRKRAETNPRLAAELARTREDLAQMPTCQYVKPDTTTRTSRPAGDVAFVSRIEKITGRDLSKGKPGRPRKRTA